MIAAVVTQSAWLIWFVMTHWISLPPLNDLSKEAFAHEKKVNLAIVGVVLASIAGFYWNIGFLMWFGALFWTLGMFGHIMSWWVPYFFGWPKAALENAVEDNGKTVHFLPARGNHPIPDLTHCMIGVLTIAAWIAVLGHLL